MSEEMWNRMVQIQRDNHRILMESMSPAEKEEWYQGIVEWVTGVNRVHERPRTRRKAA
jgi:hypothetical protein